jgi:hypothetical protein
MFWGPSKWGQWNNRVNEMNRKAPKYLMAFNEPDVKSQSNMNPYYAAQLYMEQINRWSAKGAKLGSPAIVWDLNWMNTFLNEVKKKGGHVDFLCLHWYGSYKDLSGFQKYIQTAHSRFGKNIWVTEMGITSSSNPSQHQVKQFMMKAFTWMDSQPYVERGAWFGAFEANRAPDAFATAKNALFKPGGALGDLGMWYSFTERPDKRSLQSRHRLLSRDEVARAAANSEPPAPEPESEAIHCDEMCKLRNEQISSYEAEIAGSAT